MYCLGIDIGGTKTAVGIVNEQSEIIHKESAPTIGKNDLQETIAFLIGLISNIIIKSGIRKDQIKHVGIGCPGTVNYEKGIVMYSSTLGFKNAPLAEEIKKHLGIPVFADNDANCAALAENCSGAASGTKNSVTITIGTGIGGGIFIDGKIYRGFNFAGGELGHMKLALNGKKCSCGRIGCWETLASGSALAEQTRKAAFRHKDSIINTIVQGDMEKIDGKTAFDAALMGDDTGKRIIEKYVYYLSEGLINIINILMPEMLVIGGGLSNQGDYLLAPVRKLVSDGTYGGKNIPQTEIKCALFGNDAGIIGAAMLDSLR